MTKRNLLALTMAGALSLTLLAGCAKSDDSLPPETTPPAVTDPVIPEESPEVTPDLPEETPAETPEGTPDAPPVEPDKPQDSQKPAETQKPSQKPAETQKPTETQKPAASKVQSTWDDISKLEIPALMDVDAATLTALYGIDSADLVEFVCKMPMVNVQATEFFIAQVKDGKMDTVKAGVASRQANLEAEWGNYLPEQLALVQDYKLVTNGNYILFVVSDQAASAVTAFDSYTK